MAKRALEGPANYCKGHLESVPVANGSTIWPHLKPPAVIWITHVDQASWWRLTEADIFGMDISKHDGTLLTLSER
jgi:hypothetical protein